MTSPTSGMTLGERIAHVGARVGETTTDKYTVTFGSHMAVAAFLRHWVRDVVAEQPAHSTAPIVARIEAAEKRHGGLRPAAKALGIDPGYLFRLKNSEKMNPSEDVLNALGLERVTFYRIKQVAE